jgi:hypothetical protein
VSKYSNLKGLQVRGPRRKNSLEKELLNRFQLFALVEHNFASHDDGISFNKMDDFRHVGAWAFIF